MKKYQLRLLFLLLGLILIGCSAKEEVSPPTKQKSEKTETEQNDVIDPKELLNSLKNHTPVEALGDIPIPADNPMEPKVLQLGQALFFDPRLSGNNEVSCATCHDPNLGYGDDRPTFKKIDGSDGARNSPTIINSGYYTSNFWDGRAKSLEEQALGPIQNPNEMNQSLEDLLQELKGIKGYEDLFLAAFSEGITEQNIAKALAAFQRQIVVKDTRYDQFLSGNINVLTQEELRGLRLFTGEAFCATCHNGPNLSDNQFYNVGLNTDDEGRFAVTKDVNDIGRIRTPGLYGITHTGPYMHNGSIATLEEVVEFYDRGGDGHPNTSFFIKQFMQPLELTDQEKEDLVAFLKTLGGKPPVFTAPVLPGEE